jgi:hypothetical protein
MPTATATATPSVFLFIPHSRKCEPKDKVKHLTPAITPANSASGAEAAIDLYRPLRTLPAYATGGRQESISLHRPTKPPTKKINEASPEPKQTRCQGKKTAITL